MMGALFSSPFPRLGGGCLFPSLPFKTVEKTEAAWIRLLFSSLFCDHEARGLASFSPFSPLNKAAATESNCSTGTFLLFHREVDFCACARW